MRSECPELPAVGIFAAILVLIPLPRQIRARNVASITMIFWFFASCLVSGINAIVWAGNVNDSVPFFCELTIYISDGILIALPAATLCICKRLELIASGRPIALEKCQWRRICFEVFMCIILPCIWMFVSYCFQIVRYFIVEDFGCYTGYWLSYISIIILFSLPVALAIGTFVYGTIAFYHLIQNHRTKTKILTSHLVSRNSGLSSSQYYRLMAMSMVIEIWGLFGFLCGSSKSMGSTSTHFPAGMHCTKKILLS